MIPVTLIPVFQDNYIFLIADGSDALIVDPGEPKAVTEYLLQHGLNLKTILITHHHNDHLGGLVELKRSTQAKVYAPQHVFDLRFPVDEICKDGSSLDFQGLTFQVIGVPGHTLDHLAYYCAREEILFCGDTLFSLGCGRLFEGTPETMFASLAKLKALPPSTRVFCAHEYTLKNLDFTLNQVRIKEISKEYEKVAEELKSRRAHGYTIPSTLSFEQKFNLFLRANSVAEFRELRQARDTF